MQNPIVSIVIPTFNRPARIFELASSMIASGRSWTDGAWEIVISDNHSNESVEKIVAPFLAELPIKVHVPPVHLDTAEENTFFAWSKASGEYVWVLGDDDPIEFDSLSLLLQLCAKSELDAMIWDSRLIGPNGGRIRHSKLSSSKLVRELPLKNFCLISGFWYVSAGLSTWVVRRKSIDPMKFLEMIQKFESPIYGHVTGFLKELNSMRFAYVNSVLVSYRVNYGEDKHWSRYTARNKIPLEYPWTYGFLRQIEYLVDEGILTWNEFGRTADQHRDGKPFLLFNVIIEKAINQILNGLEDKSQRFSLKDGLWLTDTFAKIEPRMIELWLSLRAHHLASFQPKHSIKRMHYKELERLKNLYLSSVKSFPFWNLFIGSYNGWDIYKGADDYFAVKANCGEAVYLGLTPGSLADFPDIRRGKSVPQLIEMAGLNPVSAENSTSWGSHPLPLDVSSKEKLAKPFVVRLLAHLLPKWFKQKIASWVVG